MRGHRKLQVFQAARSLAVQVYRETQTFPSEERFGLTSQLRRGAVSIASNVVEGSARHTEKDYLHFLDMAHGAARELEFQLDLAMELGFLDSVSRLLPASVEVSNMLNARIRSLRV
jgi:four helix bundle protein